MTRTILTFLFAACLAVAQTTINGGRTITGPWDASGATSTKPHKTGTSAPATCAVGETFFDTDATAGQNSFACTATNTWTLQGGSYTLPTASAGTLGGVKVGTGLSIDGGGVLSASLSGIACDPSNIAHFCLVEEFSTGTTSSAQVGTNGLKWFAVGSGTLAGLNVGYNTITNHPGVFSITSTTSANSGGILSMANGTTGAVFNVYDLLNLEWEVSWIFKLDSITDVRARFGLSTDVTNLSPASSNLAVILRYDTDSAFSDHTKNTTGSWVAQFCGYNGGACGDTSGAYFVMNTTPDTNWHRARIYRSGTTIYFQIDDGTAATMCSIGCDMTTPSITNPSSLGFTTYAAFGISSTTQRRIWLDRAALFVTGLTRY